MSLKIWLPLDGDLRNLGCSRAQIINNGATIDNNGKIGKCYNFDGESQYLQITNFTVDAWPQMTIMFWSNNGPKSVFTLKSGTTSTGNMQFRSTSNSHFYFRDKQHSTETQVALTTTIAANVWAHYAFIYNNGSWRAYINGVLSGEFNAETPTTLNNNNQVLWICNGSTASSSVFKSGKINDFRLYDSALSAAEVHEIAQGLVLHYKLDNIINGIVDSSGYGHNGEISGNISINNNSHRYANCIYIPSGNTDYITTNTEIGNFSEGITMNIWFKSSNITPGNNYHEIFNIATATQNFEMAIHKNGYLRSGMIINGTRYIANTDNNNLLNGNWHMITMTYDGHVLKRYVDGENKTNSQVDGILTTTSCKFLFGHYGTNVNYHAKEAYLSDIRIYCTPLLDTDIKLLYNIGMRIDNLNALHTFELNEQQYPSPIYSSETGSILTFNNKRLNNLIVNIEPVQNFNGYAKPWPGGTGKNLMPGLVKGAGINSTNGEETVSEDAAVSDYIPVVLSSDDSYYLSGLTDQIRSFVAAYNASKEFLGRTGGRNTTAFSITQSIFTNGTPSGTGDIAYIRVTQYKVSTDTGTIDLVDNLQVQLEVGSTATTYEPYSNICPITGWTGANVRRTGKNLIDDTIRALNTNGLSLFLGSTGQYTIPLKAGTYTLSVDFLNGDHYGACIREKNDSSNTRLWATSSTTTRATFTLQSDGLYRIWVFSVVGQPVTVANVGHAQLEAGSVATAYEPYQGDTIAVAFPSAAGTVYGGILDLVAGTLTVDRALITLDSTIPSGSNGVRNIIERANCVSFEYYPYRSFGTVGGGIISDMFASGIVTSGAFMVESGASAERMLLSLPSNYNTEEKIRGWFAANTSTFVCYVATPVVYALDPIMLTTLLGTNTFWADSGNITIQYRTPQTARLMKTGTLITEEYQEANKTSIYQNGMVEATEFIEI